MGEHDVGVLEEQTRKLQKILGEVSDGDGFAQLLRDWHFPGWTTPAEFRLVRVILDTMVVQAESLVALKSSLVEGSREIVAAAGGAGREA